jgi:hypothetical protein
VQRQDIGSRSRGGGGGGTAGAGAGAGREANRVAAQQAQHERTIGLAGSG